MSESTERVALLTLALACRERSRSLAATLERVRSARAVLAGEFTPQTAAEAEVRAATRGAAPISPDRLDAWAAQGLRVTGVLDDDYPLALRTAAARPAVLWYRGTLAPEDAGAIAVVGTRAATAGGRATASRIAGGLAAAGVTVVSGLARGIDTAAHVAALGAGGRTVAVLGHGLARPVYPHENAALAERIAAQGALLSPFAPEAPPTPDRFRARNAVTAGLTAGSVIVEAGPRSGARLEARLAAEQGRRVCFSREMIEREPWAQAFAAAYGATVVDDVRDLLVPSPEHHGPAQLRLGGPQEAAGPGKADGCR